jgi:hypothetical protein
MRVCFKCEGNAFDTSMMVAPVADISTRVPEEYYRAKAYTCVRVVDVV